jgi:hypothetical protein
MFIDVAVAALKQELSRTAAGAAHRSCQELLPSQVSHERYVLLKIHTMKR